MLELEDGSPSSNKRREMKSLTGRSPSPTRVSTWGCSLSAALPLILALCVGQCVWLWMDRPACETATIETRDRQAVDHSPSQAVDHSAPKRKEPYYKQYVEPSEFPNEFDGVWARPFEKVNKPLPCFPAEPNWRDLQTTHTDHGLLFLKTYKAGSSTASGIHLRLARNQARRQSVDADLCQVRYDHAWAAHLFWNVKKDKSFLWTIVRDPTQRLVSQFFHFEVSREKTEPSDAAFVEYVRRPHMIGMNSNYYMDALPIRPSDVPADRLNSVLDDYNFIAVTERMDESAVALSMVAGIPLADVLYLKAKGHGGFDDGGGRDEVVCTYIWPSFVTPGMEEYFQTDEFQDRVRWDHALYQAANRSLDLTIEKLGREEFERKLALYRAAQARVHDECLDETVFPCSAGGDYTPPDQTDCMWNDSACGMDCLDRVATELDLW